MRWLLVAGLAAIACPQPQAPRPAPIRVEAVWYGGYPKETFKYVLKLDAEGTLSIENAPIVDANGLRDPHKRSVGINLERARQILSACRRGSFPGRSIIATDSPMLYWKLYSPDGSVTEVAQSPDGEPTAQVLASMLHELRAAGAFP